MTSHARRYRNVLRAVCAAIGLGQPMAACRAPEPPPIDLIHELPHAERRASGIPGDAIHAEHLFAPAIRDVLNMRAPARVTWTIRMPRKALFRSDAALSPGSAGVTVRIGISNGRRYDELSRVAFTAADAARLRPLQVDLSEYSGWAWSLFYRPATIDWKLIINADASPGGTISFVQPQVGWGK